MDARRVANLNGAQPQFTRIVNANEANTQRVLASLDVNNKQSVQAISRILQMSINDLIANTDRKNVRLVDLILGRTASLMDETVSRLSTQQLAALKQDVVAAIQQSSIGRLTTADKADIIKTLTTYFDSKTNLAELKAGIAKLGILASDQNTRTADVKATVINSSQQLISSVNSAIMRLNQTISMSNFGSVFKMQQLMLNSLAGIQQQNAMALAQLDAINTMNISKMLNDMGMMKAFGQMFEAIGAKFTGRGDPILARDLAKLQQKTDLDWTHDFVDNAAIQIMSKIDDIGLAINRQTILLESIGQQMFGTSGFRTKHYNPSAHKYQRINTPYKKNPDRPPDGFLGWISKPFEKGFDLIYDWITGHERMYDIPEVYQKLIDHENKETQKIFEQTLANAGIDSTFIKGTKAYTEYVKLLGKQQTKTISEDEQKKLDDIKSRAEKLKQKSAEETEKQKKLIAQAYAAREAARQKAEAKSPRPFYMRPKRLDSPSDNDWFGKRSWGQSFRNFFKAFGNVCEWLGTENGGLKFWEHMKIPMLPEILNNVNVFLEKTKNLDLQQTLSEFIKSLDLGKNVGKLVDGLTTPDKDGNLPLLKMLEGGQGNSSTGSMFDYIATRFMDVAFSDANIDFIASTIISKQNLLKINGWLFEGKQPLVKTLLDKIVNAYGGGVDTENNRKIATKFIDRFIADPKDGQIDYIKVILDSVITPNNIQATFDIFADTVLQDLLYEIIEGLNFTGDKSIITDSQKQDIANRIFNVFVSDDNYIKDIVSGIMGENGKNVSLVMNELLKTGDDEPSLVHDLLEKIISGLDFSNDDNNSIFSKYTPAQKIAITLPWLMALGKHADILIKKTVERTDDILDCLFEPTYIDGMLQPSLMMNLIGKMIDAYDPNKSTESAIDSALEKGIAALIDNVFSGDNLKKITELTVKETRINSIIDQILDTKDKDGNTLIQKLIIEQINKDNNKDDKKSKNKFDLLSATGSKIYGAYQGNRIVNALADAIKKVDLSKNIDHLVDKILDPATTIEISGKTVTVTQYLIDAIVSMISGDQSSNDKKQQNQESNPIVKAFATNIRESKSIGESIARSIDKIFDAKYNENQTVAAFLATSIADIFVNKLKESITRQSTDGDNSGSSLQWFFDMKVDNATKASKYIIDKLYDKFSPALIQKIESIDLNASDALTVTTNGNTTKCSALGFIVSTIFNELQKNGTFADFTGKLTSAVQIWGKEIENKNITDLLGDLLGATIKKALNLDGKFDVIITKQDLQSSPSLRILGLKEGTQKFSIDNLVQYLVTTSGDKCITAAFKSIDLKQNILNSLNTAKFEIDVSSMIEDTEFKNVIAKNIIEKLGMKDNELTEFTASLKTVASTSKKLTENVDSIINTLKAPKSAAVIGQVADKGRSRETAATNTSIG